MKDTEKHVESRQLHKSEGCSLEDREELENKEKVQSVSLTSERNQNDRNMYDNMLMEKILDRDNMNEAFKRVKQNKGSHGIDGLAVDGLHDYLREHGEQLRKEILEGNYSPYPVRRVEIPKDNGKKRKLGIPAVVDRVIQQSITQILSPIFEEVFSENSFGFRPKRSCHDALRRCQEYINSGCKWVVDIDLAEYFDTVNHDKLIGLIHKEIGDIRVISLIRKYLQSGVMERGIAAETDKGVPQGGNLSPLLSNIMLNELDKELTQRGLKFVRYADDCNIYVKSRKSANRVMASITKYIEGKLKLKVNKEKSVVGRPWELKFLGYTFYSAKGGVRFRVHKKPLNKFKQQLRELTSRSKVKNIEATYTKIKQKVTGWINYFKIADMRRIMRTLDEWLRRRIRMCYWKHWKKVRTKYKNLIKLGASKQKAWEHANTRRSYWRTAKSPILQTTLTDAKLKKAGLISLFDTYMKVC